MESVIEISEPLTLARGLEAGCVKMKGIIFNYPRLNNSLMKYCVCIYVVCYSINIKCLKKLLSYGIQKKKYIYVCYTEQN